MYPGGAGYGGYQGGGYPGQQPGGYPGQQPVGYPGQQPEGYPGGYGNAGAYGGRQPGVYPETPGVSPDIAHWFRTVDRDGSGKIDSKELQAALVNGQGKNFSETACDLMIAMFDDDRSGTIDVEEFQKLFAYVNQWLTVFRTYDGDQSGFIDANELSRALQQMGFRFSPEFVNFLVTRSDLQDHRKISVDQFIVLCVQIQRFTEAFRSRDAEQKGVITIAFEDFLGVALSCSV